MKKLGPILFACLTVVLLGSAMFVLSMMKRPLSPALALDVPSAQSSASGNAAQAAPVGQAAQAAVAAPKAQKTCGNTGKMSILVLGQGLVENQNLYRTGAIRLVVVDFDQPKVSILSMPGELWVDAKVLKDQAIPSEKLDLIYHHEFTGNSSIPENVAHVKGTQALAQAVVDNFGFVPDHYVTILQEPFVQLVDTLGGIDVDLPTELVSITDEYGVYPAGPQHLSGLRTLNLTRSDPVETGYNAWSRFDRQEIVLKGLLAAIMKPENWANTPELAKQARKTILTDLSVDQAMDLLCMVEKAGGETNMLQVKEEMVSIDDESHWKPDFQAIAKLIQQMYGE